jgi:zinc transport system permease protein
MALGGILVDLTPGDNVDLMSYLFGSILTVPTSDLWQMLAVSGVIAFMVGFFYNDFLAFSYDEEFARLRGVPVRLLHYVLLAMVALSVVMMIREVGLILLIALLTISPYIAERYSKSLWAMMILSTFLNALCTTVGLWLSYTFNLTSGATIIMVAASFFIISFLAERLKPRRYAWISEAVED